MKNFDKIRYSLKSYWYLILLFGIVIIFWKGVNSIILAIVVPIVTEVADENWLVCLTVFVLSAIPYFIWWDRLQKEENIWTQRRINALAALMLYLSFRLFGNYVFYSFHPLFFAYLDLPFLVVFFFEFYLVIMLITKSKKEKGSVAIAFEAERPTKEDRFDREGYAEVLAAKIAKTFLSNKVGNGSFTILLNERYGTGKTSFFMILKDYIESYHIKWIEFKPWLCSGSDRTIQNFFNLLSSNLGRDNNYLAKALRIYSDIVTNSCSNLISCGVSSIFENKHESIESQYEDIRKYLIDHKNKIVITIDDVDRLQPDELISVLKLIRNTADFPNIVYIIAADKDALKDCLSKNGIEDADFFLRKFFNMELLFPALEKNVCEEFFIKFEELLKSFVYSDDKIKLRLEEVKKLSYIDSVFKNMRDVYRYINLLSFSMDSLKKNNVLGDVEIIDLVRITIVQFLDVENYKVFRDHDDYFLTYISSNDRLVLKDGYRNAFRDRKFEKQFNYSAVSKKQKEGEKVDEIKKIDSPTEAISDAEPTILDIVCDIVADMFGDALNFRKKSRICFGTEYFKYFAGHYRNGELTNSELIMIIQQPEIDFERRVKDIISNDNMQSLVHKMLYYVENIKCDRLDILKKTLIVLDVGYSNDVLYHHMRDFYEYTNISNIIFNLFHQNNSRNGIASEKEINEFDAFFSSYTRYGLIALVLKTCVKLICVPQP